MNISSVLGFLPAPYIERCESHNWLRGSCGIVPHWTTAMACTLTVDQILGVTNAAGVIVRLIVRGTADECKKVRVVLDKDNPAPAISLGPVEVDVNPPPQWEVAFLIDEHFKEGDLTCGNAKIVVSVTSVVITRSAPITLPSTNFPASRKAEEAAARYSGRPS